MGDPDYQMALMLARQFEEENKFSSQRNNPNDVQLAMLLQQEFQREQATEKIPNNLYYEDKKNKNKDSAKSLIDPTWELVDPTPNIHNLFVIFNERFFWNKLLTVCVSWSKRMTSCAGICSYNGRGGLCSITLSEPLLKLRPRKDLVETLLHEMIHAFLFVTHNNRDRDGHGPEFHKHMYRINGEAGTNITVYHDFHDEVRLYKQHWWRCNGPCQTRKPFFGMVRRAMNRAPGPYDRWWGEHSRTCGGQFIKVKEPEKPAKKSKTEEKTIKENISPKNDIRNYMNSTKGPITAVTSASSSKPNIGTANTKSKSMGNIFGFNDLNISPVKNSSNFGSSIVPKNSSKPSASSGNIVGFKDLGKAGVGTGIRSNSISTLVINQNKPKINSATSSQSNQEFEKLHTQSKSSSVSSVSNNTSMTPSNSGYEVVRNHWLSKFDTKSTQKAIPKSGASKFTSLAQNTTSKSFSKRRKSNDLELDSPKKPRLDKKVVDLASLEENFDNMTTCPVCEEKVDTAKINEHLDECLFKPKAPVNKDEKESCPICEKPIPKSDLKDHMSNCLNESFEDDVFSDNFFENCPNCNEEIQSEDLADHQKSCLKSKKNLVEPSIVEDEKLCSICEKKIPSKIYDLHGAECLLKFYNDIQETHKPKSPYVRVSCLVCSKKINKSELNSHLDDCMNTVFDKENDFETKEINEVKSDTVSNGNNAMSKYNCPICMDLVLESEMNTHLDNCVK